MKTSKLHKLAYAAQILGRDVLSDRLAERLEGRLARVRIRRQAWAARGARHPFLAGFGGAFVGLMAFVVVMMALAAVFALLGVVLKVALIVGAVYLVVRMVRHFKRQSTQVVIVPPDDRAYAARYRS